MCYGFFKFLTVGRITQIFLLEKIPKSVNLNKKELNSLDIRFIDYKLMIIKISQNENRKSR